MALYAFPQTRIGLQPKPQRLSINGKLTVKPHNAIPPRRVPIPLAIRNTSQQPRRQRDSSLSTPSQRRHKDSRSQIEHPEKKLCTAPFAPEMGTLARLLQPLLPF